MVEVIRAFCWHQKFVPKGFSAFAPGLYTCIESFKTCLKSYFKEIVLKVATNGQSDKGFLLTSNICPQGVVCPCPGAIYMYKIIKIYTRTRRQVSVYRTTGPLVCFVNLVSFLGMKCCWHEMLSVWNAIKVYGQWVSCGHNSSSSFPSIFFLNFADVFCMDWSCASGFGIILWYFLSLSLQFSGTNLSFSSDSTVARLYSDPLTTLVFLVKSIQILVWLQPFFGCQNFQEFYGIQTRSHSVASYTVPNLGLTTRAV